MADEGVLLTCTNARCPVCRRPFKPRTNILRLQCHHGIHLRCSEGNPRCPVCVEPFEPGEAHDSDDEDACTAKIETMFSSGVSLDAIKNQAIAVSLEALRDLGLRRSHFVRYPQLATGPALARFPSITAAKLLAYFGITARDAPAMFTVEQRVAFGYRR